MASLTDVLSVVQNGVVAFSNLGKQMAGSLLNISDSILALQALVPLAKITASLGADVALNNTAIYFDGPSIAQGTVGTWFVSGTISVTDTAIGSFLAVKLWDGTTIIASASSEIPAGSGLAAISLSGYISNPSGDLKISCRDTSSTTGKILFNNTGSAKDSTISAIRIG